MPFGAVKSPSEFTPSEFTPFVILFFFFRYFSCAESYGPLPGGSAMLPDDPRS